MEHNSKELNFKLTNILSTFKIVTVYFFFYLKTKKEVNISSFYKTHISFCQIYKEVKVNEKITLLACANSKNSDRPAQMRRPIVVFAFLVDTI